jgi:uncharacterized double-CXXCG motif protein
VRATAHNSRRIKNVRLFRVSRDLTSADRLIANEIIATHTWALPGIQNCPRCYETWASCVAYPDVDLSTLPGQERYRIRRPQSLYIVHRMREAVRPFVAAGAALPPGAEFGPLVGHGKGAFGDFGWPAWPGVMLVRPDVGLRLDAAGITGLRTAPTRITYWGSEDPLYREAVFGYEGRVFDESLPPGGAPACAVCGHRDLPSGRRAAIDPHTVSGTLDIFRSIDVPSCIYATSAFVEAAQALRLTDISFAEVPTTRSRTTRRVTYRL